MTYRTFGTANLTPSFGFTPEQDVVVRSVVSTGGGQLGFDRDQVENYANGLDQAVESDFVIVSGFSPLSLELLVLKGQTLYFYGYGLSWSIGFDTVADISTKLVA